MIITIDIPDELNEQIEVERNRPVHNGNRSSVVRTALVYFFDQKHTSKCGAMEVRQPAPSK